MMVKWLHFKCYLFHFIFPSNNFRNFSKILKPLQDRQQKQDQSQLQMYAEHEGNNLQAKS